MRLENVVAVTGGRLLNNPSISRFESVALTPKKVSRGSLFVTGNPEEIEEALRNGAYGIVTDKKVSPTDDEVAWIEVENLSDTLVKLLRLWLVINPRRFVQVSPQVMEFMRMTACGRNALLLPEDRMKAGETILASSAEQTLFSDNRTLLEHMGTETFHLKPDIPAFTPVADLIFESSFILDGVFHERVPLPPCMQPIFLEAVGLLAASGADYTLSHLGHTPSFEPVFVDSRLNAMEPGSTEQVLIFADSAIPNRCYEELARIKWTNCKLFTPTQIKFRCDIKMEISSYARISDLLEMLETPLKPGYYLIVGLRSDTFFRESGTSAKKFETKGLF
ncbi:hypothetical protein NNO_1335 [Hydrogenimonas sp.]|nr:hypothetical protein NNO_1335 [Hydrogenimonas sp.]